MTKTDCEPSKVIFLGNAGRPKVRGCSLTRLSHKTQCSTRFADTKGGASCATILWGCREDETISGQMNSPWLSGPDRLRRGRTREEGLEGHEEGGAVGAGALWRCLPELGRQQQLARAAGAAEDAPAQPAVVPRPRQQPVTAKPHNPRCTTRIKSCTHSCALSTCTWHATWPVGRHYILEGATPQAGAESATCASPNPGVGNAHPLTRPSLQKQHCL